MYRFILLSVLLLPFVAGAREGQPNHLLGAGSPYLQQHLFSPVDWYPWGPEALERARIENKLIFVSVGYSSCHWCHVMREESFEDTAIATFLNEHFISIKIDRERRPDLDEQFMLATQVLTGSGGWPNNLILTPLGDPVFGGTYFSPDDLTLLLTQMPEIEYLTHDQTAGQVMDFFPGLQMDDLPGGEGWAIERLRIATHNGTHLDAPYHHHSTMDGGKRALTIDEVPLEWCMNPGVKLDFRHFADGYVVTAEDVEAELSRIGHELQPLDIVVVNTSAGTHYGQPDYLIKGCGMGREATLYLTERGVRVTGTDAWSWDAPFPLTAQEYAKSGDASIIWEGHRASMEIGYCHMEKLSNLESLPPHGFEISCFPYKIKGASAGFTRAVAIFEE